jgi:hypothetical protein
MSSLEAILDEEASANKPAMVLHRGTVWSGAIVKIKIPERAQPGSYPEGNEQIPFWRFGYNVPGGVVNLFLHSDYDYRGRTIVVSAAVMRKDLEDGRSFFHLDLTPAEDGVVETHRMTIVSRREVGSLDGSIAFETPAPLAGVIVFSEPGSKLSTKGAEPVAREKSTDSMLERLTSQGWVVGRDEGHKVHLFKETQRGRKTMEYYRPKKKK